MKVLITGADGFIAKNLIQRLKKDENIELYLYTKKDSINMLETYIKKVDFIFHLAGVNRPKHIKEFYSGNSELTKIIIGMIEKYNKKIPILFSSSRQIGNESDYATSKEEAENIIFEYSKRNNVVSFIYRLPNIFGKWAKPNYNSVIATWCYNIVRNLEIQVNSRDTKLEFAYVDDVINLFLGCLYKSNVVSTFCEVEKTYTKTLGEIEILLYSFKNKKEKYSEQDIADGFDTALFNTYSNYLVEYENSIKVEV